MTVELPPAYTQQELANYLQFSEAGA
jgi:hypothetical protein